VIVKHEKGADIMTPSGANDKLCAIADTQRAHALAEKPAFVCGRCGAKSHVATNVCEAIQIPEAGWSGD
jgi:hypothetical protein